MIKIGDTLRLSKRGLGEGWEYAQHREWDARTLFIALSEPYTASLYHEDELLAVFDLDRMRPSPAKHYVWRFEVVDD